MAEEVKSKTTVLARGEELKTSECRVSFAQTLFKAREGKFGCSLIFKKDGGGGRAALDEALKAVILEAWGDAGLVKAKNGLIKSPFLDGAGKEARSKKNGELHGGMGEDVFFIRCSTLFEPTVRYKSKNVPATYGSGPDQVKSGDYGFAVVAPYAWSNDKNGDGVSFGINYFQKTRPGEDLGGTGGEVDVDKYYTPIEDAGPAPASTTSGAGAGGLFA